MANLEQLMQQREESERKLSIVKELKLTSEEEYLELLNLISKGEYVPTLYDVNCYFNDIVTGEEENRMTGFLLFNCADQPVIIDGMSGSGKTHLINAFTSLILENTKAYVDSMSEKAWIQMAEQFLRCSHIIFSEYNKINGVSTTVEIMKSWGEGAPFRYSRANIGKGKNGYDEFILYPRPFVISIADESKATSKGGGVTVPTEIRSRCVEMTTDSSSSQTKSVMLSKAKSVANPFKTLTEDKIRRNALLKLFLTTMPDNKKTKYIISAAEKITEFLPSQNPTSNRNIDKLYAAVGGACRFNYKNRMSFPTSIPVEVEDESEDVPTEYKDAIFCTPEDVYIAYRVYAKIVVRASLQCNIRQKMIMSIIENNNKPMNISEIFKQLREAGGSGGQKLVSNDVDHLIDVGYLDEVNVISKREKYYDVTGDYKELIYMPPFKDIIEAFKTTMKEMYPKCADEFIERYCGDGEHCYVQDPFTGEQVDLMKYVPVITDDIDVSQTYVDYINTVDRQTSEQMKKNTAERERSRAGTFDEWL